jgi:hypothetical protein
MRELAERARADLGDLDCSGVAAKLNAIVAAAKCPLETVAVVASVVRQTVLRWVAVYGDGGADGFRPEAEEA